MLRLVLVRQVYRRNVAAGSGLLEMPSGQAAEEVDTTEKNMETSTNATGRGAQHTKRENSR